MVAMSDIGTSVIPCTHILFLAFDSYDAQAFDDVPLKDWKITLGSEAGTSHADMFPTNRHAAGTDGASHAVLTCRTINAK